MRRGVLVVVAGVVVLGVALAVVGVLLDDEPDASPVARSVERGGGDETDAGEPPTALTPGEFVEDECPVDPGETDIEVTCGWLEVPARRDVAGTGTFELAVAILHARDPDGPVDPVLYLSGGPGAGALAELEEWTFDPLLDTRDVILVDQRGTGFSLPDLSCPEVDELDDAYEAERRCRARLEDEGVDLAALRTAETAADVADLRVALGHDSWNLWGSSYGTRVALTVLRDHPAGVRAAVLEGAYPHQIDAYADATDARLAALDHLTATCAADATCAAEYGDQRRLLTDLVIAFDDDPIELDDGEELDGVALVEIVLGGLGSSATLGALPGWLGELADGGTEPFEASAARRGYSEDAADSPATFYVIECAEEVAHSALAEIDPDDTWAALRLDGSDPVAFHAATVVAETLASCAIWDTGGTSEIEDAPVTSDVPVLVFAGGFDPQTPPWWGREAASALANGTLLEFPHLGHDTIDVDPCARSLFEAFVDEPGAFEITCELALEPAF